MNNNKKISNNSNNNSNKINNSNNTKNTIGFLKKHQKKIIIGVVVIIILGIIYYFLTLDYGHKVLFDEFGYFYGDKVVNIGSENMKDSEEGVKYSFSLWYRLDNVSANAHWDTSANGDKIILFNNGCPNILYLRKENVIKIQIAFLNTEGIRDYYDFILPEIESQIWTNLFITIDNRNVNIYKNSILLTTKILPHVNIKTYKMLSIGSKRNNFNGYIGYVEYFNYIANQEKINYIYNKRKNLLPLKVLSYEQYEYLRKIEEEENSHIKKNFKNLY
tara:strand:- start:594 stop:1418 length:825 start_codon:yes stop_codon:yes gene_type:complete